MSINNEKFQSAVSISLKGGISQDEFYQKNVYETPIDRQINIHPSGLPNNLKKWIELETLIPSDDGVKKRIKETYTIIPKTLVNQLERCNDTVNPIYLLKFGGGNFALKFYYPNPYDDNEYNKFYMTYCKKNSGFITGYEDYKEGVLPSDFISAMSKWSQKLPINTKTKLSLTYRHLQ
jgi:hypothetical protein